MDMDVLEKVLGGASSASTSVPPPLIKVDSDEILERIPATVRAEGLEEVFDKLCFPVSFHIAPEDSSRMFSLKSILGEDGLSPYERNVVARLQDLSHRIKEVRVVVDGQSAFKSSWVDLNLIRLLVKAIFPTANCQGFFVRACNPSEESNSSRSKYASFLNKTGWNLLNVFWKTSGETGEGGSGRKLETDLDAFICQVIHNLDIEWGGSRTLFIVYSGDVDYLLSLLNLRKHGNEVLVLSSANQTSTAVRNNGRFQWADTQQLAFIKKAN